MRLGRRPGTALTVEGSQHKLGPLTFLAAQRQNEAERKSGHNRPQGCTPLRLICYVGVLPMVNRALTSPHLW
jgi:hypothetical protein